MKIINPFHLLKGVSLQFIEDDPSFDGLAGAAKEYGKSSSYIIKMNKARCYVFYKNAWLNDHVSFEAFITALKVHEIVHILYGAFNHNNLATDGVWLTISNILLDSQGEYSLTNDYPGLSIYIRICLLSLRRNAVFNANTPNLQLLEKRMRDLFYLARFGVIFADADMEFVNFALPLVLSATRKSCDEVHIVTILLYQWLVSQLTESEKSEVKNSKEKVEPLSQSEIDALENADQIASSSINGTMQDVKGGSLAGSGDTQITVDEKDNHWYHKTIQDYPDLIRGIRLAFKRRLDQIAAVSYVEGELNYQKQQQAYVDSFTGDQSYSYNIYKRKDTTLDVVIARDISDSTSGYKEKYCTLMIALIAAISDLPGIRISEIDWSSTAALILDFDQPIRQARLFPRSEGGTMLVPALNITQTLKFKSRKKIFIGITDGDICDLSESEKKELELSQYLGIKFSHWTVEKPYYKNPKLRYTTFDTFPNDIADYLLKEL